MRCNDGVQDNPQVGRLFVSNSVSLLDKSGGTPGRGQWVTPFVFGWLRQPSLCNGCNNNHHDEHCQPPRVKQTNGVKPERHECYDRQCAHIDEKRSTRSMNGRLCGHKNSKAHQAPDDRSERRNPLNTRCGTDDEEDQIHNATRHYDGSQVDSLILGTTSHKVEYLLSIVFQVGYATANEEAEKSSKILQL